MAGFEPGSSGSGSNFSANCATTTYYQPVFFKKMGQSRPLFRLGIFSLFNQTLQYFTTN